MAEKMIRRRKMPVQEEERQLMLFWYTVYEGNYNRVAKKVSELTGIPRSRKVVFDIAKRNNFATLSHVVRDEVNKKFYDTDTPGMGRIMKLTADMMEINEDLVRQCKLWINDNKHSKIVSLDQLLKVMQHVFKDLENVSGEKNLKGSAFHKLAEQEKMGIGLTIDQVLKDMSPDEQADLLGEVVEQQIDVILENKGETTKRGKQRKKKYDDEVAKAATRYFNPE